MHYYCKACGKLLDNKKKTYRYRVKSEQKIKELTRIATSGREILIGDLICKLCCNKSSNNPNDHVDENNNRTSQINLNQSHHDRDKAETRTDVANHHDTAYQDGVESRLDSVDRDEAEYHLDDAHYDDFGDRYESDGDGTNESDDANESDGSNNSDEVVERIDDDENEVERRSNESRSDKYHASNCILTDDHVVDVDENNNQTGQIDLNYCDNGYNHAENAAYRDDAASRDDAAYDILGGRDDTDQSDDSYYSDGTDDSDNIRIDDEDEVFSNRERTTKNRKKKKHLKHQKIEIEIDRTISAHSKCVVCSRKYTSAKIKVIKHQAIIDVYLKRNILIPFGTRACLSHFNEFNFLNAEAIDKLRVEKHKIAMSPKEIKLVIELLKTAALNNTTFKQFEKIESLSEATCFKITGMFYFLYILYYLQK